MKATCYHDSAEIAVPNLCKPPRHCVRLTAPLITPNTMVSKPPQEGTENLRQLRKAISDESTTTFSVVIGKCFELSYQRIAASRALRVEWKAPKEVHSRLAAEAAKSSFPFRLSLNLISLSSISKREILKFVEDFEEVSNELTPKVEEVIERIDSYPDAQSLLEAFDDVFLSHPFFSYWQPFDYETSDPRFGEHQVVLDCLINFPVDKITERKVDHQPQSVKVKRSRLLTQVSAGLEDQCIASVLICEIVNLAVMLENYSVGPALELFAFKPMSLRVVVVPVLSTQESRDEFYQRLIQRYWTQVTKLIDAPMANTQGIDFFDGKYFEGVKLFRYCDVRRYETYTLWLLHVPRLTLFHQLLWKNCKSIMQAIPLTLSSSSSPLENTVMESPLAGSFSTTECFMSNAFFEPPDLPQNTAYRQFVRLKYLTTVSTGPEGESQWTMMEGKSIGFLSDKNDLSDLLTICPIVKSLHEEGLFHGLLSPSTIRVSVDSDHFLSLTSFSWENLPLLYFAIPLQDRKTIAPEVRLFAESLQLPSERIDFSKSDTYGLSALILIYGLSLCERNARLKEIVTQGRCEDWRLRPQFADVAEELRIALNAL